MKTPSRLYNYRFQKNLLTGLLFALLLGGPWASSSHGQIVTQWGNTYVLGGGQTTNVTPTASAWVTFTATEDMQVSAAQIYNSGAIVGSPSLSVSIRAVNGTGSPTGPTLGINTFSPTSTGWQRVTLPNVALTQGVVYAMEVITTTPSGTYPWRLNSGATGGVQPYGTPDTHFLRGVNAGAPTTGQNVWVLETNIGRAIGQPYTSSTAQNAATANSLGQRFVFDQVGAGGNSVESVTLQLGIVSAPPAQPVTVKLISSTGVVLATTSRDLSGAALGAANYTFDLDTPISLTDSSAYYIALYSNGSTAGSVTWYGWNTTNDPLYIGASFQGADAYSVLWGSQSDYTGVPTSIGTRDYAFSLGVVPEPSTYALMTLAGGILFMVVRRKNVSA